MSHEDVFDVRHSEPGYLHFSTNAAAWCALERFACLGAIGQDRRYPHTMFLKAPELLALYSVPVHGYGYLIFTIVSARLGRSEPISTASILHDIVPRHERAGVRMMTAYFTVSPSLLSQLGLYLVRTYDGSRGQEW